MWSFWRERKRKAQIRTAFADFVSEEGLKEIENASGELPRLRKESIRYVILQVRDDTPETVQHHLAQVLAKINDGIIEDIMSSIVTVIFTPALSPDRLSMDALLDKLGSDVRAVYGAGDYLRGTIGSNRSFRYGTIFPDISSKLEILFQLEFGTSREV